MCCGLVGWCVCSFGVLICCLGDLLLFSEGFFVSYSIGVALLVACFPHVSRVFVCDRMVWLSRSLVVPYSAFLFLFFFPCCVMVSIFVVLIWVVLVSYVFFPALPFLRLAPYCSWSLSLDWVGSGPVITQDLPNPELPYPSYPRVDYLT